MGSNRVIAERYELLEEIGSGGQGVVWRARDLELNRVVALKCSSSGDKEKGGRQIRREAVQGAALDHPNVIMVLDTVEDQGEHWVVQQYFASRDLHALLNEDGVLPPERAARIGEQLASALARMHANDLIHQDVKPANVLVNDRWEAKLTDLGIARWAQETGASDGFLDGTPEYVAPEVANGQRSVPASDVFSLGATLYAAVEGRSPWGGDDISPIGKISRAARYHLEPHTQDGPLGEVLDVLLRRDPSRRPSAEDARAMLHEVASGSEVTIRIPASPRPRRRWPVYAGAAAAVVALVVAAVVIPWRSPLAEDRVHLLGDVRTADPCALVDASSLSRFGEPVVDDDYGNFNRCDVLVRLKADDPDDEVDVRVELLGYPGTATPSPTATVLSSIQRSPLRNGQCERQVSLPDGHRVLVAARHTDRRPAPLCDMADALISGALVVLNQGQVRRRAAEPPPNSLLWVDACTLLSRAELAPLVGEAAPDAGYGNWNCGWEKGRREVEVVFDRDQPLTEKKDGHRVDLGGGREGFVESDEDDRCEGSIAQRATADAYGKPVLEVVRVHLRDDVPGQTLCPQVTELTRAVASRLPR